MYFNRLSVLVFVTLLSFYGCFRKNEQKPFVLLVRNIAEVKREENLLLLKPEFFLKNQDTIITKNDSSCVLQIGKGRIFVLPSSKIVYEKDRVILIDGDIVCLSNSIPVEVKKNFVDSKEGKVLITSQPKIHILSGSVIVHNQNGAINKFKKDDTIILSEKGFFSGVLDRIELEKINNLPYPFLLKNYNKRVLISFSSEFENCGLWMNNKFISVLPVSFLAEEGNASFTVSSSSFIEWRTNINLKKNKPVVLNILLQPKIIKKPLFSSIEHISVNNGLLFLSKDKVISAFKEDDKRWSVQSPVGDIFNLLIYEDLLVVTGEKGIGGIDILTGKIKWFEVNHYLNSYSPAISKDRLFYGDNKGFVFCKDLYSGKEIWRFRSLLNTLFSPVIINKGVFFIITEDKISKIFFLDIDTGTLLWVLSMKGKVFTSPAGDNYNKIFVPVNKIRLYCLNERSKILWVRKFDRDDQISFLTYKYGFIIAGTKKGKIFALESDSGKFIWQFERKNTYPIKGVFGFLGEFHIIWSDKTITTHLYKNGLLLKKIQFEERLKDILVDEEKEWVLSENGIYSF